MLKIIPVKELGGGMKKAELERGVSGPETHRKVPKPGFSELCNFPYFIYLSLCKWETVPAFFSTLDSPQQLKQYM